MGTKRHRLFEHYRKNLVALLESDSRLKIHPERDDIVVCPLCFNEYFTVEDVDAGYLTLEHAPPGKLAGKGHVLTCFNCNNNQGSYLDSELIRHIRYLDALNGIGHMDVTVNPDSGGQFRAKFRCTDSGWELLGIPKASRPEYLDAFTQHLKVKGFSFRLTSRSISMRRVNASLIRSAYLLAFQHLGYSFLINFNLGRIRHQLNHPTEDVFPQESVIFPCKLPDGFLGVNMIANSPVEKCYFVVFDVRASDQSYRAGVIFPGPNVTHYNMFSEPGHLPLANINVNHFDIAFHEKLDDPWLARTLWNSA